jgi:dTDP-4-dehydrorhamnose 3,5-epimerase
MGVMIDGVAIKPLQANADERGSLMEILRCDDEVFDRFGQCYTSTTYPGIVRAWHYHYLQDDFFVVVKGMIKVALFDGRAESSTKGEVNEYYLGERNNIVLRIPRGVMHGFKAIGTEPAILLNFPTEVYRPSQPDEYRLPWNSPEIPYDWAAKFS